MLIDFQKLTVKDLSSKDHVMRLLLYSAIAFLLIVSLFLRLYQINASFWLDEILQLLYVSQPFNEFWQSVTTVDLHPPLDFMIGRIIYHGLYPDHPEVAMRLPALMSGLGILIVLFFWFQKRVSLGFAFIALCMATLSPAMVRYSQEFRPYALGLFLFVLSLFLFERMTERFTKVKLGLFYFVVLATWYTDYLALAAQIIMLVYLLIEKVAQKHVMGASFLKGSPFFFLALIIGYTPWLIPLINRSSTMGKPGMGHYTIDNILSILNYYAFGWKEYDPITLGSAILWVMVVAGFILSLLNRKQRFLCAWLIAVPCGVLLLQKISPQFPVARYFIMASPAVMGCAGALIYYLWQHRWSRPWALIMVVFIICNSMYGLAKYFELGRPEWRTVADHVRDKWQPGERVFAENGELYFPIAYYLNGAECLLNHGGIPTYDLQNNPYPLNWAWKKSRNSQLVIYEKDLRNKRWKWADGFMKNDFSREGISVVRLPKGEKPKEIPRDE